MNEGKVLHTHLMDEEYAEEPNRLVDSEFIR